VCQFEARANVRSQLAIYPKSNGQEVSLEFTVDNVIDVLT